MGLPYENDDYGGAGGGSGSASTINDLGGMNFSTLDDNELMKRVDSNNVGGSGLLATETTVGTVNTHTMITSVNPETLGLILSQHDSNTSVYNLNLKAHSLNASTPGLVLKDDGSAETDVGINVGVPTEALDVEGNLKLRVGDIQYQLANGTQIVELDGSQDGTNGGQFVVKTKIDNGAMTQKLTINNDGAIGLGSTPAFGTAGNFLMSLGSGSLPEWFVTTPQIVTSVIKTASQAVASATGSVKIINWATPHVNLGTSGWDSTNSKYVVQRTATYRINLNVTINNTGNDTSSLRLYEGSLKFYNSSNTLLHTDKSRDILFNVDNGSGRKERATISVTIIRTLNATEYIETDVALSESTGSYNIDAATLNIEQVGAGYVAGVGQFLPLTGGTVTGIITAPTYKTTVIPTLTNEIGYNNSIAIATGITLPKYNVAPFHVSLGSHTLNPGVYIVYGSFTTDGFTGYGTTAILHDGTSNIAENFTVVVSGGFTSSYVTDTVVVPVGTTKTIQFRANVNVVTSPAVQTIAATKYNVVRIA